MTRKQILILAGLVVFLIVIVVTGVATRRDPRGSDMRTAEELLSTTTSSGEVVKESFTSEVPSTASATKPIVEIPVAAQPGQSPALLGSYDIVATTGGYSPSSLTAKQDDIAQISFTSRGGNFDFSIPAMNIYLSARDGEKVQSSFRMPTSGTFLFECRDMCPAEGKIQGTLIVLP